jgi:hypothetical protein
VEDLTLSSVRERASVHTDLAKRLDGPEQKTEELSLSLYAFSRGARVYLRLLFDAILKPMWSPNLPKRPIGL